MVLAMPLPAPFSTRLWLEFNPGSEPKILSPTSLLQRGHDALIFSHLSTQSLWKKWEHGSSLSSSLFAYFAKQMQQTCTGYNIRSSVIMPITRLETMHREYDKYISNDHDKEPPRIWRYLLHLLLKSHVPFLSLQPRSHHQQHQSCYPHHFYF